MEKRRRRYGTVLDDDVSDGTDKVVFTSKQFSDDKYSLCVNYIIG